MKISKIPNITRDIAEEQQCYEGICPKCGKKIELILITAKDGCWSEHFECGLCSFMMPNQSMAGFDCLHQNEIHTQGRIITGIKELSNIEYYEISPEAQKKSAGE